MTTITDDVPRAQVASSEDARPALIRPPHPEEINEMLALFEEEVRAGRMLPRDPHKIATHLGDWLVAEEDGHLAGCVSLVFFNQYLCELRSLAVHQSHRGNGLGGVLIRAALGMAQQRGARHVLTLTRAIKVFEQEGFVRDEVSNYPEKVWRDCAPCPFHEHCDETALVHHLPH